MDKVVFAGVWVFVFAIPWENSVTVGGFGTLTRLVGAGAVALGLLTLLTRGTVRRFQTFHVLALAFVAWSALGLLWTVDLSASRSRVLTYAQLFVVVALIWQHARSEWRQRGLLQAYVFGAYVTGLSTLANYVFGVARYGRYTAEGFGPNDVACILALGVPIAWHLMLTAQRGFRSWMYGCYVPAAVLAVPLTGSRGGTVALITGLTLIPWSLSVLSAKARVGISVLLIGTVVSLTFVVPEKLLSRIGETPDQIEEGDFTGRGAIWAAGIQVFAEHPVLGVGAGGFDHVVEPILGRNKSPHQTFLSVLIGQGLIGLGLFLGMFAAACWSIPRMRGAQRKFWIVLMLTLFIGLLPRTWDYRKTTWFLLAAVTAQSALLPGGRRRELVAGDRATLTASAARPASLRLRT